jgi:hypothetical protein
VDVNTEEVTLEWEGKVIHKKVDELLDRTASAQQNSAPPAAARTEQPAAAVPPPQAVKSAIGPGADTGRGTKVCDPNDNMPIGTVVDGYRKTARETPFGQACVWEQVGR